MKVWRPIASLKAPARGATSSAMDQKGCRKASRIRGALLVFFLSFLIYNSNFRLIRIDDSVPARLLPFVLIVNHSFNLDGWVDSYLPRARGPYGTYFVTRSHGHWMSTYPILTPLVVTPLYVPSARWLSQQCPPLGKDDVVATAIIDLMEKLSASLVAALSAAVLYLALRQTASPGPSLFVALVYGLASNTWTISSQSLWRHGFTQVGFALLLWGLLRRSAGRSAAFWAGLGAALAAANKPADAAFAALFLAYFWFRRRDQLAFFCAPLLVVGALVVAYNLHFFGRLLGAYPNPVSLPGTTTGGHVIRTSFWAGVSGLLLSPSRGLVIFTPWVLLSFWGAAIVWKEKLWGFGRYLVVAMAAVYLLHARFGTWWGGWAYGPRYLTDVLPFLALFLVPVWPRISSSRLLRAGFVLGVACALWVQIVGAFYYPRGEWDAKPISVDLRPDRIWNWSDSQIMRSWTAGRADPFLLDGLYLLARLPRNDRGFGCSAEMSR